MSAKLNSNNEKGEIVSKVKEETKPVETVAKPDVPTVAGQNTPQVDNTPVVELIDIADSGQPRDLFYQFDSTINDMKELEKYSPLLSDLYKSAVQLLPGFDPLTKRALAEGDTRLFKEFYGIPGLHFINQRLLNYPRAISEKMGIAFPESETAVGNALARTAGVVGAIQSFKTGEGLAGRTIPFKPLAGISVRRAGARGGIAAAVQGGLYAPEGLDYSLSTTAKRTALSFMLGYIGAGTIAKVQKFKAKVKLRGKTTLKGRVEKHRANTDFNKTVEQIQGNAVIDDAQNLLKQSQDDFQKITVAQHVQGKIPETEAAFKLFSENLSDIYVTTVDDISRKIGDISTPGARKFFKEWVEKVSEDPGLKATTAMKRVKGFIRGIKKGQKFKDLNEARKAILKSKKFKGDIDDEVFTKFRRAFNDYAETIDSTGRFAQLNKTMRPQLDFKGEFIKRTKIYNPKDTRATEKLFRRYASGQDLSRGEKLLMDDAMKYLGKYGLKFDDIKNVYATAGKAGSVSRRIESQKLKDVVASKLTKAIVAKTRKLQDIKLGPTGKSEAIRIAYQALNLGIRFMLARLIYSGFKSLKEVGGINPDTATRD